MSSSNPAPFLIVCLVIVGIIVWRYIRFGSMTGVQLGAKVESTLGEVEVFRSGSSSRALQVLIVRTVDGRDRFVGLSIVSRAPFLASTVPVKLDSRQAQELVALLQKAEAQIAD